VMDGIGDIAIGSDTGGSTRIPAAFCGAVGFKPTVKRVPRKGAFPLSYTLDSIGPIARNVADCAKADAVLSGDQSELPQLALTDVRAGFVKGYPSENLDAVVGKAFPEALAKLSSHWKSAADVTVDAFGIMQGVNARGGIAPPEAHAVHRDLLAQSDADGIDPNVRFRLERAAGVSAADYIHNLRDREKGIAQVDVLFARYDVLVMPTVRIVAPLMEDVSTTDGFAKKNVEALLNTSIWNFFDVCAISLPISLGNALPCGLMLVGRHGQDKALLAVAAAVEKQLAA
jgi:aspartyl-tRNA(Asn)/glutamyl-tRNA(Gln) amidotransferase subunit A